MTSSRQRLIEFLRGEIEGNENLDEPDVTLISVLYEAVRGLEHLERGECDAIFKPGKKTTKGKLPATLLEGRAEALGYVALLRKLGLKAHEAQSEVGKRYGEEANNIRQWKKTIGKSTDPILIEAMKRPLLRLHFVQFNKKTPLQNALKSIEQSGKAYLKAKGFAGK